MIKVKVSLFITIKWSEIKYYQNRNASVTCQAYDGYTTSVVLCHLCNK